MGKHDDDKSSVKDKKVEDLEIQEPGEKKGFPYHVGFILGNEFCERYSYYGMRTVLVIYLTSDLIKWDDNTATAVYHAFTVLAYLFPLLGAMIADSWWGKYWTILSLSVVYAIGSGINMMSAIEPIGGDNITIHAALTSIGLFVIAFGTGGIKPCVSAFGGDQFTADQDNYRRSFFSLFYFAINAGSLVSTFVSPLIRDKVQCFGDDCYALAFGVPTALMFVAIILFVFGTKYYTRLEPSGNVFAAVTKTMWRAIKNRSKTPSKQRNKEHWLDYAADGTNSQEIQDIKYVLRVLILYIPLPLFWSLFDQQGSRWTLQAVRMNGIMGDAVILPDQFQICNPLIIILLIPLFEATLYPFLRKKNINFSPLKRMGLGMWLAGLAFIVAALVQSMIDENLTLVPRSDESSLRVLNGADVPCTLGGNIYGWDKNPVTIGSGNTTNTLERTTSPGFYNIEFTCGGTKKTVEVDLEHEKAFDLIIYMDGTVAKADRAIERQTKKSNSGKAYISIANAYMPDVVVSTKGDKGDSGGGALTVKIGEKGTFEEVNQDHYTFSIQGDSKTFEKLNVLTGASYTVFLNHDGSYKYIKDIYENDVNLFWMVPQYFIITLGEVFLSVTGLEFAYSQAPQSMKSVLQSFWLLTVSIGNIIVLIVAETSLIPSQANEYYLFAGLIAAAAILFMILASQYEYVDESSFHQFDDEDNSSTSSVSETEEKSKYARTNEAFEKDTGFEKNTKL